MPTAPGDGTNSNVTDTPKPFRILSLDGGGAKGFYTLGILDEIEKNTRRPIVGSFDLIFGTSTGSIIATLLARGDSAESALLLYRQHVPAVMAEVTPAGRTKALINLARTVFGTTRVEDFRTAIGVVATNWKDRRPLVFKTSVAQAHGSKGSFVPFFGCTVADAVISSCCAHPFFATHSVTKSNGDVVEAADGGFCANNPTLYAIADATAALNLPRQSLRVMSLGVGSYPEPSLLKRLGRLWGGWSMIRHAFNSDFLQLILETNTQSMDVLRGLLFADIPTIRISETFAEPEMATDLLEHDLAKLNRLVQKGRLSYAAREKEVLNFLA